MHDIHWPLFKRGHPLDTQVPLAPFPNSFFDFLSSEGVQHLALRTDRERWSRKSSRRAIGSCYQTNYFPSQQSLLPLMAEGARNIFLMFLIGKFSNLHLCVLGKITLTFLKRSTRSAMFPRYWNKIAYICANTCMNSLKKLTFPNY